MRFFSLFVGQFLCTWELHHGLLYTWEMHHKDAYPNFGYRDSPDCQGQAYLYPGMRDNTAASFGRKGGAQNCFVQDATYLLYGVYVAHKN